MSIAAKICSRNIGKKYYQNMGANGQEINKIYLAYSWQYCMAIMLNI